MNKHEKTNFWLYAIGRLVSLIGSGIQMIAIPLYILDVTGSGTLMGVFTMLSILPSLIISPFAGVLGDRFNRKNIMVNMDFARGFLILFMALLAYTGNMSIVILFICQVFISIMNSIFNSSTGAMMPELVSEEDLLRGNSIMGGVDSFSMIIGPTLGGVIFGIWGIKAVFLINGVSFVLSAISEMFIKYKGSKVLDTKLKVKDFTSDMREGLVFIKNSGGLLAIVMFFSALNFLANPAFAVIMPYIFKIDIGFTSQQFGLIESIFTFGVLLGNILIAVFLSKVSSGKLLKVGLVGMVFFTIVLGLTLYPSFVEYFGGATWTLLIIISMTFAIMGAFNSIINTPINTSLQKLVPNEIRSRVFSVVGLVAQGATPIGAVLYGILLDTIPSHHLFMTIAIMLGVVSVIFVFKAPVQVFDPEKAKTNTL